MDISTKIPEKTIGFITFFGEEMWGASMTWDEFMEDRIAVEMQLELIKEEIRKHGSSS